MLTKRTFNTCGRAVTVAADIVQGNKVAVLVFERFRIKATGCAVDNEYVHISTLSDGECVQWGVYEDTAPLVAASRDQEAI
jgi:ketosteroid isomerase-like protein